MSRKGDIALQFLGLLQHGFLQDLHNTVPETETDKQFEVHIMDVFIQPLRKWLKASEDAVLSHGFTMFTQFLHEDAEGNWHFTLSRDGVLSEVGGG